MLMHDFRNGFHLLLKRPSFAFIAVLALALGIGASTVIFSAVNAVLLRPLPYKDPNKLVVIWNGLPQIGFPRLWVSVPELVDYTEQNQVFESIAATSPPLSLNLIGSGDPERVQAVLASPSLFPALGVNPMLGRTFSPDEDQPGRDDIVVLSYSLWQRFGADRNIVGRPLNLDGKTYTVVGVMPNSFQFPREAELWLPLVIDRANLSERDSHFLTVIARLRDGVTLQQAQANMDGIARNLQQQYPNFYPNDSGWNISLLLLREQVVGDIRPALLILLGAVGFVLLIACANVANLLLARASDRKKEIAIRVALGASRGRIIQQLIAESVVLSLLGGVFGLLLAYGGVKSLMTFGPDTMPQLKEASLDLSVLIFALLVSLLTAVLSGLAPALQASKSDLNHILKEGGRGPARSGASNRFRSLLIVFELSIALVLLTSAGLMIRSFMRLQNVDPGFAPQNLLTMQVSLPLSKYKEGHQIASFYKEVFQRLDNLAGIESAGGISELPLSGAQMSGAFTIQGHPPDPGHLSPEADRRTISPGYFHAMGIPLLKGRFFTDADDQEAQKVVIIDEAMSRRYWPDEDPVGKQIKIGSPNSSRPWLTIIGVVGQVKHYGLGIEGRGQIYLPYMQNPWPTMFLVVRASSGELKSIASIVRGAVWTVDKDQSVAAVKSMEGLLSESVAQPRFNTLLLGLFASIAIILALVGIYGVISYSVRQRTHEIGVRIALGARPVDIIKMVLKNAATLIVGGVAIGLIAAMILTRVISSLLFGVSASDPITFIATPVLLATVALIASFIPAYRAARVDPNIALHQE